MLLILSGKELHNTNDIAHKHQESNEDLAIMRTEFTRINRVDKAIFESEQEILDGA